MADSGSEVRLRLQRDMHVPLARVIERAGAYELSVLRHGDFSLPPAPADRFGGDDTARRDWALSFAPTLVEDDPPGRSPWVEMAAVTRHPAAPYQRDLPREWKICGRLDARGDVELAALPELPKNTSSWPSVAARVLDEEGAFSLLQLRHGDASPALRLASDEEAREVLFIDGKLKKSTAPKCLGVLMERGVAHYRYRVTETRRVVNEQGEMLEEEIIEGTAVRRTVGYYGHIWAFYGALLDGVFYLVSLPVYNGEERGSVVVTTGVRRHTDADGNTRETFTTGRVPLPCPPTQQDLMTSGFHVDYNPGDVVLDVGAAEFAAAAALVFGEPGMNGVLPTGWSHVAFTDKMTTSEAARDKTPLCRRVLARVRQEDGGFELQQCVHGDVGARGDLRSSGGGWWFDGGPVLVERGGVAVEYEDLKEHPGRFNAPMNGTSLYLPYRVIDASLWSYARFFAARMSLLGRHYTLDFGGSYGEGVLGPRVSEEEAVLTTIHCHVTTTIEEDGADAAPPPVDPPPGEGEEKRDERTERPEGEEGELYEYAVPGDAAGPLRLQCPLGDDDMASYVHAYGLDAARALRFTFSLDRGSRFFRTPAVSYAVQFTVGGSDGPYSWMGQEGKFCNIGTVSLAAREHVADLTVAWVAPLDAAGEDKMVSTTQSSPSRDKSGLFGLQGAVSCPAMTEITGGHLIVVEDLGTATIHDPEAWYEVRWSVREREGEKRWLSMRNAWFTRREEADAKVAELQGLAGLVGSPRVRRHPNNDARIRIHKKLVRADVQAIMQLLGWNKSWRVDRSGEITVSATSGSYFCTCVTPAVCTVQLPS